LQIVIFAVFAAVPLLMFMSVPLLGVSDGILVPTIILLSMSALVHSLTLIASTPPLRKYIHQVAFGSKKNNAAAAPETLAHRENSLFRKKSSITNLE
ncbi:hypothetical protein PENTCL1PPCAC_14222, partial [Pristionchus entomophagus]